mmetsp:Transcript_20624/g.44574  ORF Transcript_20624/g.44574 Transcript_20624/m.44574 type:complete len:107 (-) Transcript_20624:403-723(-)
MTSLTRPWQSSWMRWRTRMRMRMAAGDGVVLVLGELETKRRDDADPKHIYSSNKQEGARKDVERFFCGGVLYISETAAQLDFQHSEVLRHPAQYECRKLDSKRYCR